MVLLENKYILTSNALFFHQREVMPSSKLYERIINYMEFPGCFL